MKVGLISLGFPNFRYDIAQEYLEKSVKHLERMDYELVYHDKVLIEDKGLDGILENMRVQGIEMLIVQCGTYSHGSMMMKITEWLKDMPLLIWGFREPMIDGFRGLPLNSLCGLNMYASFLKKVDKKFSYVYGAIDEKAVYEKVEKMIRVIDVKVKLKASKFCIIGSRVPGFYLSNVDELRFRHQIGPELLYYSIASLLRDAQNIDTDRVKREVDTMKNEVAKVTTTDEMLEKSARVYLAIEDFKESNNIDAFTIKCWPEFQELYGLGVCGVVSRLNNKGITTSCEGDVSGLVTMYIQYLLSKQPCFFADFVNINEKGIAKMWHCGPAPLCLANNPDKTEYREHPTIKNGIGMAVEFELKKDYVTMMKIKEGKNKYELFMAKGMAVDEDRDLVANQLDVKFDKPIDEVVDIIMNNGVEHHYVLAYKDLEKDLLELCKWMDIQILK
ncbi:L-fucose/L-arabinose isomerase family protein [Abyssisolibacter fermentans]|uniref:L-fucose/L-arabinose isomerase family protein n=1 Tax=Abyssisolibacter fermentans TaxID=1766203 RepID=UPI00082A1336|nr:L-fucose/L-arabinose isomerase family protein [Abyssisolibacter fermentans]